MAPETTSPIVTSLSLSREEVPHWIAAELKTAPAKVAQLEVSIESENVYTTLTKYLAHRAVDIDQTPPRHQDRVHKNPTHDYREWPGVLTSIYNAGEPCDWQKYDISDEGKKKKKKERKPDQVVYCLGSGWARCLTNPINLPEPVVNGLNKNEDNALYSSDTDAEDDKPQESAVAIIQEEVVREDSARVVEEELGDKLAALESASANGVPVVKGEDDVIIHHFARGEPGYHFHRRVLYRVLVLYGTSPDVLRQLCRDAMRWKFEHENRMMKAKPGKYVLYTLKVSLHDNPPRWICHGHRKSRPFSSIVLPEGIKSGIIEDLSDFLEPSTRKWYESHGVPFRRSYLLYGPPGGGKTSTIKALAGKFDLKACFLSLSHRGFGDQTLVEALTRIPRPCVLVLEDVDVLFNEARKGENASTLTFSGLLNAVDGMVSSDGVVMVMTTNHIERLDPALLRCGRVDRRFRFKMPGQEEVAQLFLSFYPKASKKLAKQFAEAVFERKEKEARSIATLQEHFIFTRKSDAEESVKRLDEFFEAYFPNGGIDGKAALYL